MITWVDPRVEPREADQKRSRTEFEYVDPASRTFIAPVSRPPKPEGGLFPSQLEREKFSALDQACWFTRDVPDEWAALILSRGGDTSPLLLTGTAKERANVLIRLLLFKSGSSGDAIATARKALVKLRSFAKQIGAPNDGMPANAMFVNSLVASEDARARASGGSRGGSTVGENLRLALVYCGDSGVDGQKGAGILRLPIDATSLLARAAAPFKPNAGEERRAGSFSLQLWVRMCCFAECAIAPDAHFSAFATRRFVRVCLAFGLHSGQRLIEVLRTSARDAPPGVMHGHCSKAKDGNPLDVFSPAEGPTGPFLWYPELLSELSGLEYVLQAVSGVGGLVTRATAYRDGAMSDTHARDSYNDALALIMPASELKLLDISGHSLHGSFNDIGTYIGSDPIEMPDGSTFLGISPTDLDVLGNWKRTQQKAANAEHAAKAAATTAIAAGATGATARRDAAVATHTAAGAKTGTMQLRYASGAGHSGEQERQLSTRRKLVRYVRACLVRHAETLTIGDWPRGRDDWSLLRPHGR